MRECLKQLPCGVHFPQGEDYAYLDPDAYIAQWVLHEYLSMSKVDVQQVGDSVTLVGSAEDPGEAPGHGFIQCNRKLT